MEIPKSLMRHPDVAHLAAISARASIALGLTAAQHKPLACGIYDGYVVFAQLNVARPPPAPESPAERLLFNTGCYIGRLLASLKE